MHPMAQGPVRVIRSALFFPLCMVTQVYNVLTWLVIMLGSTSEFGENIHTRCHLIGMGMHCSA